MAASRPFGNESGLELAEERVAILPSLRKGRGKAPRGPRGPGALSHLKTSTMAFPNLQGYRYKVQGRTERPADICSQIEFLSKKTRVRHRSRGRQQTMETSTWDYACTQ